MSLIFAWTDLKYSGAERRAELRGALPVPRAASRFRIGNRLSRTEFIQSGRRSNAAIAAALERAGTSLRKFQTILDFGCGCGRMTRGMIADLPQAQIYGTDVDSEAIAWCQHHLTPGRFTLNQLLPTLDFADGSFDLIYAHSVFTHIDEQSGQLWLQEFHRVLQPGGYVVFTVHGEHVWRRLPPRYVAQMEQDGFLFLDPHLTETDGAFHTRDYIKRITAAHFHLLDYAPRAMLSYQDIIVLRKK